MRVRAREVREHKGRRSAKSETSQAEAGGCSGQMRVDCGRLGETDKRLNIKIKILFVLRVPAFSTQQPEVPCPGDPVHMPTRHPAW